MIGAALSDIALPDIAGLVTSALSRKSISLEHHLPSKRFPSSLLQLVRYASLSAFAFVRPMACMRPIALGEMRNMHSNACSRPDQAVGTFGSTAMFVRGLYDTPGY